MPKQQKPPEVPRVKVPAPQRIPVPVERKKRFEVEPSTPPTTGNRRIKITYQEAGGKDLRVTNEGVKIGDFGVFTRGFVSLPKRGEQISSPNLKYRVTVKDVVHVLDFRVSDNSLVILVCV